MPINRRQFVQSSLMAGAGLMINPVRIFGNSRVTSYFGVHPFILQNPEAVFILETTVDMKTNAAAIREAGQSFGRSVFALTEDAQNGVPLTHNVVIKPNLTCLNLGDHSFMEGMGIITDANFVEGIIESLKELGIASGQFYIREVNCGSDLQIGGYTAMANRTGIDLKGIETPASSLNPDEVQWVDVPEGVWFRRIPYLWPVNAPDTFLLNISKFKAHGMGLTLCAKNLQGTIAMNYQAHCTSYGDAMYGVNTVDLNPQRDSDIWDNYIRHKNAGIPRWDRPGSSSGGIWQETWATRCLDNNSVTHAGLHIIEGIYGRDGNWFDGPNDGKAQDYLTNYIIFGRNPFHVDSVGHFLGGHEPGNFGLFHMAKERGLSSIINPAEIPIYRWDTQSGAVLAELESFQRYPLKTYYLRRDYAGQSEDMFHLVNEPYNYNQTGIQDPKVKGTLSLESSLPNPVTDQAIINFSLPASGHVTLEIINAQGELIEVMVDGIMNTGQHSVIWDSRHNPSGLYICVIHYNNQSRVQKMIVRH